jgi:uncharacterized protein (DUF433 family)
MTQTLTALLSRITCDPEKLSGKPAIRGYRLAVENVLGMMAAGDTAATLLEHYPFLQPDDIRACLLYAHLCTIKHPDTPESLVGLLEES